MRDVHGVLDAVDDARKARMFDRKGGHILLGHSCFVCDGHLVEVHVICNSDGVVRFDAGCSRCRTWGLTSHSIGDDHLTAFARAVNSYMSEVVAVLNRKVAKARGWQTHFNHEVGD